MSLLGRAAIAMWWDMAPEHRVEFEDWHSHEHFPERMSVPGFMRGSRWADEQGGEGFFVLYELNEYETLTSPTYRARLNDPTPWSREMMPRHRHMTRSQCHVVASFGAGIGRLVQTVQFSLGQRTGNESAQEAFTALLAPLTAQAGITGAHLLRTDTPAAQATTEQRIRGGDKEADWILMLVGYAGDALAHAAQAVVGTICVDDPGGRGTPASLYDLRATLTSCEV